MSAIWEIQHRLFLERLDAIETELTPKQLTQLASATRMLLALHPINRNGYCRICIGSRWWRFPRSICTIYAAFAHPRPANQHDPQDDALSSLPDWPASPEADSAHSSIVDYETNPRKRQKAQKSWVLAHSRVNTT